MTISLSHKTLLLYFNSVCALKVSNCIFFLTRATVASFFGQELFWCPRLERVSLAGNLISALPLKPTARPTYSDGLGSDLSETPPNSTPAAAGGALEAASTSDTSATTITSSKSRETVAPLAALKHLDLSFNCFAVEGLHQAWVFTDTLLEG